MIAPVLWRGRLLPSILRFSEPICFRSPNDHENGPNNPTDSAGVIEYGFMLARKGPADKQKQGRAGNLGRVAMAQAWGIPGGFFLGRQS
jgi:hypothetical protein